MSFSLIYRFGYLQFKPDALHRLDARPLEELKGTEVLVRKLERGTKILLYGRGLIFFHP